MKDSYEYLSKIDKDASNLIKALQTVQNQEGFVSDQSIATVAKYFSIPDAEVEGVLSFYAQFRRSKPGRFRIAVCDGTACHIKGSPLILDWISTEIRINSGETDEKGLFSLETVACLGCCRLAPVMSINGKVYGNLDRKSTVKIIKEYCAK
ncbi:MAG: NADH-quinone oxidoreductase subunit NuoE family protein [Victivallaceae bacterium]